MSADKKEEILKEVPFLADNEKWGGTVQVIRVTAPQVDGTSRVFINKRLMFTGNSRYINLPRNGVEELVAAIMTATQVEREAHEEVIAQLNTRSNRSGEKQPFSQSQRGSRR